VASLSEDVARYLDLLRGGRTVEAMEAFYDEEVIVFENRTLARAGRQLCVEYERAQLAQQPAPRFAITSYAVNPENNRVFLEYTVRFTDSEGRAMRLEEVAVQTWHRGKITQERFYYEGFVDESDGPEGFDDSRDSAE
jgi:SnoaL-like domain